MLRAALILLSCCSLVTTGSTTTCRQAAYSEPIAGYKWMSALETRQLAQVNPGNPARLRAAMDRFVKGQNLTVVFLGGSISAGQGAVISLGAGETTKDCKGFPFWAEDVLTLGLAGKGGGVTVHNGAVPGTLSAYMSACQNVHSPKQADVFFVGRN